MAKLHFNGNTKHTIGVEFEFGVVDSSSFQLTSGSDLILSKIPDEMEPYFKHELVQSCVEVISGVCGSVSEIRDDLSPKVDLLEHLAQESGMRVWWGGTHPFSLWQDQETTRDDRYLKLVESLQQMAHRLVTFGMHVHIGVDSGDKAVMICDRIMQYLPLFLSISSSSPFWQDQDTGLCSYRSKLMEGLPTAGLPEFDA